MGLFLTKNYTTYTLENNEIIDLQNLLFLHINFLPHMKTMVEIDKTVEHGHILLKDVITKKKASHPIVVMRH